MLIIIIDYSQMSSAGISTFLLPILEDLMMDELMMVAGWFKMATSHSIAPHDTVPSSLLRNWNKPTFVRLGLYSTAVY